MEGKEKNSEDEGGGMGGRIRRGGPYGTVRGWEMEWGGRQM